MSEGRDTIHCWPKVAEIFDRAFELSAGERAVFLARAASGEAALVVEAEALLAAAAQADHFLETPIGDVVAELLAESDDHGGTELVGERLGPYQLTRWIAGGGMGDVYEAHDHRLRRRVAVKLLPAVWSRDTRAKKRFLREARAAAAVDHPNICNLHDIGETDEGQLYLVMAFYQGESLAERLTRGQLSIAEACRLAVHVACGLEAAHEARIIHRDLKPSNVMISDRGDARILDFGVARIAGCSHLTPHGRSPGTPAYMSPEQISGGAVDERTDLWSLGVVIYEMLAGRKPFDAENEIAVTRAIVEDDPEPLASLRAEIPPSLSRIVTRALVKDPDSRYRSAGELRADLELVAATTRPPIRTSESAASGAAMGVERRRVTVDEYVAGGREPEEKHEHRGGEDPAVGGTTPEHSAICWNLTGILYPQLGKSGCRGFVQEMRVRIPASDQYVYPDVVVVCGGPVFETAAPDVLTNPTFVIEVLSPSTEERDRGIKLSGYRTLPSLSGCLLVAQDRVWVELWTRQADGCWLVAEVADPTAALELPEIGCTLPLVAVYAGLEISS